MLLLVSGFELRTLLHGFVEVKWNDSTLSAVKVKLVKQDAQERLRAGRLYTVRSD